MPPVIGFISAVGGAILGALSAGGIVGFLANTALGLVVSLATNALFVRRPDGTQPADEGLEMRLRIQPDHPIEVLVGTAMTGGSLVYANTRGTNNEYLERVVLLSDWRCDGVVKVYGDGEELTFDGDVTTGYRACTSHYLDEANNPCLWLRIHLGDPDQTADSELIANYAELNSNFRLRGRAYAITRMKWNRDAYPSGEAELLYVMRGAPCHDPADETSDPDDDSTWPWTDNWALIGAQYHQGWYLNGKLVCGLGWPRSRIPDADLIAAANECDETVALNAGGTEKRYSGGGSFLVGRKGRSHKQNLAHVEEAMDGSIDCGTGRSVRILPGVERTPVDLTIAFADTLAGEVIYDPDSEPAERINQSTGRFIDPGSRYEQYEIPLVIDEDYLEADQGQEYVDDPTLLFVQSFTQAQRILKRRRERSRHGGTITCSLPLFPYIKLERGDRVPLDAAFRSTFGLPETYWRVARRPELVFDREGKLRLNFVLREHPDSIGSWTPATDEVSKPGSTSTRPGLPALELSNFAVSAVELTVGFVKMPAILATWDAGDSRVRVQVTGTRLDGDEGSPVSPVETITNTVTADTGRCYVLGGLPSQYYSVAYGLASSGRFSGQTVADTSLQLTANLEPTGVGGVSAADIAAAADDGVLTPSEKNTIVPFLESLLTEYSGGLLTTRAGIYSVSTTAYTTALGALDTYLGGLTSAVDWNDLGGNTTIVGATWVSTIQAAVEARDALLDAIETASGSGNVVLNPDGTLDNGVGTGGGVTFSGLGGGDLGLLDTLDWGDLTGRPVWLTDGRVNLGLNSDGDYLRDLVLSQVTDAGALAALDAVAWASDISGVPANLAALTGSEGILNTLVSINADGSLSGAGSGNVTLAGIGAGNVALLDLVTDAYIPSGAGIKQTKLDRPVAEATRGTGANFTSTSWADIASGSVTNIPDYPGWLLNGTEFNWPPTGAADSAATVAEWRVVEDNGVSQIVLASGELRFDDSGGPVVFDAASSTLPDAFWYGARPGTYTGSLDIRLQCQITSGSWIAPTTATRLRARLQ